MKILVTVEVQFEVEVDTDDTKHAVRAVNANWDSYYKAQARWADGVAPQYQGGHVVDIRPAIRPAQEA